MRRTRTIGTIGSRCRRRPVDAIAAMLAAVAIILRLAAPIPVVLQTAAATDLVALYGEHALCLANAAADGVSTPGQQTPPQPDHHADHDCPGCCAGMAVDTGALPRALGLPIDFTPLPLAVQAAESPPRPLLPIRPAEPRGPPALG